MTDLLPPLGVEAKVSAGQLVEFTAQANDADSGKVTLGGTRGTGAWTVNLAAERFDLPFAAKLKLTDFSANGQLSPDRLAISGFKGWLHSGEFGGSATLTWQGNWKLGGKIAATRASAAGVAPGWFKDGVFDAGGLAGGRIVEQVAIVVGQAGELVDFEEHLIAFRFFRVENEEFLPVR